MNKETMKLALILITLASPAYAQLGGLNFKNGGVLQGRAQTFNADGTTLTCAVSHGVATCSAVVSGSFSSDVLPSADASFNIGNVSTPLRWLSVNALSFSSGFSQMLFANTFSTGGTNPAYVWDINGNTEANLYAPEYRFRVGSEPHNLLDFADSSSGAEIDGYQTGTARGIIRFNNLGVTIDGSGAAANLVPATDNSQSAGSTSRRWKGFYNSGPLGGSYTTQSGTSYGVQATDHYVGLSNTNARTVTLCAANAFYPGQEVIIDDQSGNALASAITINRAGADTIDGGTSVSVATNFGSVRLISDGVSKWFVTAKGL